MVEIISQDEVLLEKLHEFFKDKENYTPLVDIINRKSHISLGIIDWFVTGYAKTHNTVYMKDNKPYHVYREYKNKLKGLNKYKFDSCRRKYRKTKQCVPTFDFICTDNVTVYTTIGQLNFFKWAISEGIIDYITEHYEELYSALQEKRQKNKKSKSNKNKDEDNEINKNISVQASKTYFTRNNVDMARMTVKFT